MKTLSIARFTSFCLLLCMALSFGASGKLHGAIVAAWGQTNGFADTSFSKLTDVKAVAGGINFSLILRSDGTVAVTGVSDPRSSNVFTVPVGLSNVIEVAAGNNHALALKGNGKVVAWGYGIFAETNVPIDLSNVVAVAAGSAHSLALRSDGTVVAWGSNFGNQTTVPTGLKEVKAIAAGGSSMALRHDGSIAVWGANSYGQLNVPAGLAGVRAIASGSTFNLALKANGSVAAWGSNTDGQLNIPSAATNIIAIAAGFAHAVALRADGAMIAWGRNNFGQTNVPPGLAAITAIAAGANYNLALTLDRRVQILRHPQNQNVPYTSNAVFSIIAIGDYPLSYQWFRNGILLGDNQRYSGANTDTFSISNAQFSDAGNYIVTVSNGFGAVNSLSATLTVISPPFITAQSEDRTVRAGTNVSFSVTASGTPPLSYQWLLNGTNLSGRTSSSFTLSNVQTKDSGVYSVLVTNAYGHAQAELHLTVTNSAPYILTQPTNQVTWNGGSARFTVSARGSLPLSYQWRFEGTDIPGATNTTLMRSNVLYSQFGFYTVAISNSFGTTHSTKAFLNVSQLQVRGIFPGGETNLPVGLSNAVAVAAGGSHIMTLDANGAVKVWRGNLGSPAITNIPPTATNLTAIAAGIDHCLALRSDGTVVAWGGNTFRQTNTPPGLSNVVSIAAGWHRSFAIRIDGSVVGWGPHGIVPFGVSNVVAISSATAQNFALKRDGTVVSWSGLTPIINYAGLSNVIAIAAGSIGHAALKEDGTLWTTGSILSSAIKSSNIVALAVNQSGGMALKNDGNVIEDKLFFRLPELKNVTAIDVGGSQTDFGVALMGDGTPAITIQPVSQLVQKGDTVRLHSRAAGVQPMKYQWQLDGFDIPGATNGSLIITNAQGKDTGSYRMLASNALGSAFSATARLIIPFNTNLPATLNATNLVWNSFSSTSKTVNVWFAQIQETHDGDAAAQSGAITHNQLSVLQTTVAGPGTLSFWWKVSSEAGYDFLRFNLDAETIPRANISGETEWKMETIAIPSGQHVLRWTYSKDATVSSGRDAGWLDEVILNPIGIIRQPVSQTVTMGQNVMFASSAGGVGPLSYQWMKDGTNLPGRTVSFFTITNVMPSDAGSYALKVSNLYGSVTSSNAILTVIVPQQLNSLQFNPDGSLQLLSGDVSGGQVLPENLDAFEVQASTNVQDWITLPITPILTNGSLMFHDTNSKNFPMRFYRVVEH